MKLWRAKLWPAIVRVSRAVLRIGRAVVAWRPDVNARDVHVYGGLLLAGVGGWDVSWPWTCIAIGGILAAFGIFAPRSQKMDS